MKSVKLKIQNTIDIADIQRIYNSIVRYSFNRFQDGLNEKEIRTLTKPLFKINSWIIQCAIRDAESLFKKHKDKKIIFGGKYNLEKYLKGLISKDEYKKSRLRPINIQGEKQFNGNRLFSFEFQNNKVIFKQWRNESIEIILPPLRKNLKCELNKIQELVENNNITITVSLTSEFIVFTYDEKLINIKPKFENLKLNRVLGIDLNPNYIGLSVIEFNKLDKFKILHKQVYDLSDLNITSKESSEHNDSKYLTNKRKHELIEICHSINNLMNTWKCSKISIEELNIKPTNQNTGKNVNRLCNNVWNRNLVTNKLKMLSVIHGYEYISVNPAYSSIVGNIQHGSETCPDMIASSIEIARRGYKKFCKNWFYPIFSNDRLNEQWKQTLNGIDNWKDLFQQIKKSKLKYRFQLSDYIKNAVFSKLYKKKHIRLYCF